MHIVIMQQKGIDHIDHDGLNKYTIIELSVRYTSCDERYLILLQVGGAPIQDVQPCLQGNGCLPVLVAVIRDINF